MDDLTPIDDLAGESRALAEEVAAIVSHLLHRIDPGLGIHETTALDRLALGPRSRAALLREGVPGSSLDRLTEHGYVAEDPAWLSPAGVRLHEVLPPVLADPATATRCDEWIDAVMRGTVDRATARERFLALLDGVTILPAPPEFDAGRLIGRCPICDEWMAGARGRLRCLGCGHGYLLPGRTEVLAVPGILPTCDAPSCPVVHGRVPGPLSDRADVGRHGRRTMNTPRTIRPTTSWDGCATQEADLDADAARLGEAGRVDPRRQHRRSS